MWGGSAEKMVERKNEIKVLIGLSIALVAVTFLFGLWPRGFDFANHVNLLRGAKGVRFGNFGIAYTEPITKWSSPEGPPWQFSMEIGIRPEGYHGDGFKFLVAIHGGDDKTQLLVGQWRSWLIVMNGDDYDHKRKTKRVAARLAPDPNGEQLVTITTGDHGTGIYINGQLVAEKGDLMLAVPRGEKVRLFLGNSPDGRHPWRGVISGFAFYDHTLIPSSIQSHFSNWSPNHSFLFARKSNPFMLYMFNERQGNRIVDQGAGKYDLQIPRRMVILEKEFLAFRWHGTEFDRGFLKDAFVNFVGFIPLGFVFIMTLSKWQGSVRKWHIAGVAFLCFAISFTIEILQVWIPSRSSDLTDLILNTLGGLGGTMIFALGYKLL